MITALSSKVLCTMVRNLNVREFINRFYMGTWAEERGAEERRNHPQQTCGQKRATLDANKETSPEDYCTLTGNGS